MLLYQGQCLKIEAWLGITQDVLCSVNIVQNIFLGESLFCGVLYLNTSKYYMVYISYLNTKKKKKMRGSLVTV